MIAAPSGEIDKFFAAIGRTAQDGNQITDLLILIGNLFKDETINDEAGESTFWSFLEAGVEFEWRRMRLSAISIYIMGSADEGYHPYPRRLFNAFENAANRAEVEAVLGPPDATGMWNGCWIRYTIGETELHFEFFDDARIWTVGLSTPSQYVQTLA